MVFHVKIVRGLVFFLRKNKEFLYFSPAERSPGKIAARHHEKNTIGGLKISEYFVTFYDMKFTAGIFI